MNLETLTACPICTSDKLEPVTNGRAPGSMCLDCGTVFLNPRMDDASAAEYYQGAYRDQVNSTNVEDEVDHQRQRDRAHLHVFSCWDYIEHSRTMLEIGCSMGYLMDKLNVQFDTECIGVEPDNRYHTIEPACNFKLYRDAREVPPREFDLIAMSHSLEHMQHPREFLKELTICNAHQGTRILIEVPNYEFTPGTLNDHHPFAFTETTLNGLLARVGYKPLMFVKHGLTFSRDPYYLLGVYGRA
jgi:hypothetical protein